MSIKMVDCFLCRSASQMEIFTDLDDVKFECECCGVFSITKGFLHNRDLAFKNDDDYLLFRYLSAYTRQTSERGIISVLDTENWRDFARVHRTTRVPRKLMLLLELIAGRSSYPGHGVLINLDVDYPLFDAVSGDEARYLVSALMKRGDLIVEGMDDANSLPYGTAIGCIVTPTGWERFEPPAGAGGIPGRCFIAMAFDSFLNDAYERGIRPAILDCGAEPIRLDRVHYNEKICDKILAEIRLAQFMVADFTFQRGGVYFEAGFAMALGRPVIWTCRENDFPNTHFDTRQYNHITWSTPEELREKLTDRIRATILK
jgi:hypothetical protein